MFTFTFASALGAAADPPKTGDGEPTELRIHTMDLSASSWDAARLVDNHHPNYAADGDPKTAWVVGGSQAGVGEWIAIPIGMTDPVQTRVRLRVRNGCQASNDEFASHGRARAIAVELEPSGTRLTAELADKQGWQELAISQPMGTIEGIRIGIKSAYPGTSPSLCISDVEVFVTVHDQVDDPSVYRDRRNQLTQWRKDRAKAAKRFYAEHLDTVFYPGYRATVLRDKSFDNAWDPAEVVATAQKEPAFAAWRDQLTLAATVIDKIDQLKPVTVASDSPDLVPLDGIELMKLTSLDIDHQFEQAIRMPMVGKLAILSTDQFKLRDRRSKITPTRFHEVKSCGSDSVWALEKTSRETTQRSVQALIVGRCGRLEGREGYYIAHTYEALIYDDQGRLALVVGNRHLEAYRWETADGKAKLAGGRSLLLESGIIDVDHR